MGVCGGARFPGVSWVFLAQPQEVLQGEGSEGGWDRAGWGRGEGEEEEEEVEAAAAAEEWCVCERVWLGEAIACLIVAVAALPLLSQPERDTSGQAQPQPQQQPPRRHGGARHKERYGDPPSGPPPPGRAAGPRGHPSPPPPTRAAGAAGPPGTGPEGGAERDWGASGVRGPPAGDGQGPRAAWGAGAARIGGGGHCGSNCQRCPKSPPLATEGAGSGGGGELGEPRFPQGRGLTGINPSRTEGLIVISSLRRPTPPTPRRSPYPPPGVAIGRVLRTPSRPRSRERGGPEAGRPRGASGRGAGGPRASSPLPPAGLSLPPPGHPLPASVPLFRLPLLLLPAPPLFPTSPNSSRGPTVSHPGHWPPTPRPPQSGQKQPRGRPAAGTFPPCPAVAPRAPALPSFASRATPSLPSGEPRGAREGPLS